MRNLLRCRRGSVAFATVIIAVPLIGVLALGGEAGSWYVTKRHAQNAADAAAFSGALRLACWRGDATSCSDKPNGLIDFEAVAYRGKQFAGANAFCSDSSSFTSCTIPTNGTTQAVDIDVGTWAAPNWTSDHANGTFVLATVTQNQKAIFASMLGFTRLDITSQAIAQVKRPSALCGLGLARYSGAGSPADALVLGGNINLGGSGCGLMSDNTVKFNSTPTFPSPSQNWAVFAASGCGSNSNNCNPGVQYNYFMPQANNPLQSLDTASFNTTTGNTRPCGGNVTNRNNTPCTITPLSGSAYGGLSVTGGSVTFQSGGTYFFKDAAITINGGTVTGTNINIVLLGNSSISITGGNVQLSANYNNATYPSLNGVLIDDQAPNRSSNSVNINGGSGVTISLGGSMYFPNVDVTWNGTTANANTACTEVIANSLTMTGSAYMNTNGCAAATVSHAQIVALVE